MSRDRNVLGEPLTPCCHDPKAGFYRDGFCRVGPDDVGVHGVCAIVTEEFLDFTRSQGNDLTHPEPAFGFPGLRPGDRWCLCASRWLEAAKAGVAPPVVLSATHEKALGSIPFEMLKRHAKDAVH
ncbi:DUF2237 family protein [Halomonas dongshanensis]|uniref:DUF2237 domain-containing protein n=1 Tax=Halomonas dongshanensis TaxID=2890835 RepID=A0ABT2EFJ6_9GAMM|nr:DUF2237 domain-containing protein [Halomonas dongshanensis]MCS2610345.1 DUF2237 domain-containing protein [Halomonas dongshanensis]